MPVVELIGGPNDGQEIRVDDEKFSIAFPTKYGYLYIYKRVSPERAEFAGHEKVVDVPRDI